MYSILFDIWMPNIQTSQYLDILYSNLSDIWMPNIQSPHQYLNILSLDVQNHFYIDPVFTKQITDCEGQIGGLVTNIQTEPI